MIVCGPPPKAMWLAVELETIAKQYYHSLLIGGPVLLSEAEIADTAEGFESYGLQEAEAAPERARRPRERTSQRVAEPRSTCS